MSDTELDRSVLDTKDREELHQIAGAMGVNAATRMKKADLIDAILGAVDGGGASDGAEASDGGATQLDSVAMRPGSISHSASVGRSSSRTPRQRRTGPLDRTLRPRRCRRRSRPHQMRTARGSRARARGCEPARADARRLAEPDDAPNRAGHGALVPARSRASAQACRGGEGCRCADRARGTQGGRSRRRRPLHVHDRRLGRTMPDAIPLDMLGARHTCAPSLAAHDYVTASSMGGRGARPVGNPRVERVVRADGHNLGNREYPGRTRHPGGAPDVRTTSANPRQARRAGFDAPGSRLAADELDSQALERDQMLDRLR